MGMHGPANQPILQQALRFLTQLQSKNVIPEGVQLRGATPNGSPVLREARGEECPTGYLPKECVTFTVPLSSLSCDTPLPLRKVYALQESVGPLAERYGFSTLATEHELLLTFPRKSLTEEHGTNKASFIAGMRELFRLLQEKGTHLQQRYPSFLETPMGDGIHLLNQIFDGSRVASFKEIGGSNFELVQKVSDNSLIFHLPFRVDLSRAFDPEFFEQTVREGNLRLEAMLKGVPSLSYLHQKLGESEEAFYLRLEPHSQDVYSWNLQVDLSKEPRTAGVLPILLLQAISRERVWFFQENLLCFEDQPS